MWEERMTLETGRPMVLEMKSMWMLMLFLIKLMLVLPLRIEALERELNKSQAMLAWEAGTMQMQIPFEPLMTLHAAKISFADSIT